MAPRFTDFRAADYPRPDYVLLHISDTDLTGGDGSLYGAVDGDGRLVELLDRLKDSKLCPDAFVFNGNLADNGESEASRKLRAGVEPFAAQLNAQLVWMMGNHDTGPHCAVSCSAKRRRWRRSTACA